MCFASISIETLASNILGPIPAVAVSPFFSLILFNIFNVKKVENVLDFGLKKGYNIFA